MEKGRLFKTCFNAFSSSASAKPNPSTSLGIPIDFRREYDKKNQQHDDKTATSDSTSQGFDQWDTEGSNTSAMSEDSIGSGGTSNMKKSFGQSNDCTEPDVDLVGDNVEGNSSLSSVLNSKFIGYDALNQPLHPDLTVSKFETLMMILHLSMRYKMADTFLDDLLKFVSLIVGDPNALRVHKPLFHKLFMFGSVPITHFYCPNCATYLGAEKCFPEGLVSCEKCNWESNISSRNDGHYFVTLCLRDQIHDVISRPQTKFVSRQRLQKVVSDVMDGKEYQYLSKDGNVLADPNALTITFNTDYSPVLRSGSTAVWPIHFYINEVEVKQRFNDQNILLSGMWLGSSEVLMQVFLRPFIEELKELENFGVVWRKEDGSVVESRVYALCCCCDSLEKNKAQHFLKFTDRFACSYCLHPNTSISVLEKVACFRSPDNRDNSKFEDRVRLEQIFRTRKLMRYVRGKYKLRSNKELRGLMSLAAHGHFEQTNSARGRSIICELKYFNVVFGFTIDYLREVLMGTVKTLVGFWFDSTCSGSPFHIGFSASRVEARLKTVTLPCRFFQPRPISDRCHWNPNEWRAFLFYFGLPILVNILPLHFYNNFKKLVTAVYTLSRESIVHDEIDIAHNLLQDFVWEYQDLYGEHSMVDSIHMTGHLAQLVSKMGPLWAYSAFPFKKSNDHLINLSVCNRGAPTEINRKYLLGKAASRLMHNNYQIRGEILDFCCNVIGCNYLKNVRQDICKETISGRQVYYSLNDIQKQAFLTKNIPVTEFALTVDKVICGNEVYHSRITSRRKKSGDSCVSLTSGEFALIDLNE